MQTWADRARSFLPSIFGERWTTDSEDAETTQAIPPNPDGKQDQDAPHVPMPPSVNPNLDAIPACWAAVGILSFALANARIGVKRLVDPVSLRYEWMPRHPLNLVLANPSSLFPAWRTWQMIFEAYIARGNGYAWIRRTATGRPVELVPGWVSATWYSPVQGMDREAVMRWFNISLVGSEHFGGLIRQRYDEPASNVLALHGQGFNGLKSPSPIQYAAAAALETARASMQHNLGTLVRGLHARLAFEGAAGAMESLAEIMKSEEKAKAILQKIEEEWSGAIKAGTVPIVPYGWGIKELNGFSAVDLELVSVLNWTVDDVARVFGTPKWMMNRETLPKKLEQSGESFNRFTLQGHRRNLQDEFTVKFLSPMERLSGLVVCIDTTHYALGSLMDRAMVAGKLVADYGLWTPNEGRELTDKEPDPDPSANVRLQPKGAPPQTPAPGGSDDADPNARFDDLEDRLDELEAKWEAEDAAARRGKGA